MPVALSRADRTLLLWSGGGFVLLLALTILFGQGAGDRRDRPTTYSAGSGGAKAIYLLLQQRGYTISRWEDAPDALGDPAHTLLILAEPTQVPPAGDRDAIGRFMRGGGRVIATGLTGAIYLSGTAVPDPIGALAQSRVPALVPSSLARAAPDITIVRQAWWRSEAEGQPLYGTTEEAAVVRLPLGDGDALWMASATPFTNAGVREPGNLAFVLAAIGPPGDRHILWDEYIHGRRRTLTGSIAQSPIKWMAVQFGVVGLLVLLTYARRSGPIIAPAPESRLSPLEYVRTLGALYGRARATPVAVDIAHQRFRYWLSRRLGLAASASIEDLERAGRGRWQLDASMVETLRACEAAKDAHDLNPRTALALVRTLGAWAGARELYGRAPATPPKEPTL